MSHPDQESGGFFASIRAMGGSVVGLLHTRIELFAVELQEEKLRAINLLLWLTVAVALGVSAIVVAVGALALFLWQTTGYAGLIGLAVIAFAAAAAIVWRLHRSILAAPAPFSATTAEFRKDVDSFDHEK